VKVLVNRRVVNGPWGGGNAFVKALRQALPAHGHEVVESLAQEPDAVVVVGLDEDAMGIDMVDVVRHASSRPRCRVIIRLNECDARKGTQGIDLALLRASAYCHELVFVSQWLRDHLLGRWASFGQAVQPDVLGRMVTCARVVHNGVDRSVFKGPAGVEERNRIAVVAHHWSDNPLKGRDVYEALDRMPGVELTYIGRHRCDFRNPRTRVVPPCHGEELARALRAHSVYVTGTRFDPGPNHVLEALACGLPVWAHRDGGGAVEFAGADHTFDDLTQLDDMLTMVVRPGADRSRRMCLRSPNTYVPVSWEECTAQYIAVIEEACRR
jgi:glycosyltransferase involved in cell wall biosynthesis